ncbi:hypothetical protein [Halorussus gelatinilyticus]|nr:hypothetical protein [Halorussus gelatinilyticus]
MEYTPADGAVELPDDRERGARARRDERADQGTLEEAPEAF